MLHFSLTTDYTGKQTVVTVHKQWSRASKQWLRTVVTVFRKYESDTRLEPDEGAAETVVQ